MTAYKEKDCEKCQEWIGQCECNHDDAKNEGIIFDESDMIEDYLKLNPKLLEKMQKEGAQYWVVSFPPE